MEGDKEIGSRAIVWMVSGGKSHLVIWREHSPTQKTWCGIYLELPALEQEEVRCKRCLASSR